MKKRVHLGHDEWRSSCRKVSAKLSFRREGGGAVILYLIFDFIKEGCPSTELVYKGPST